MAKQTSKQITTLAAASVMAFSGLALAAPMFFSGSAAAASNTLYVNTSTGDDRRTCLDQANPCRTITKAISNSSNGDTIIVAAGDYTGEGSITVSKELTLMGAQSGVSGTSHSGTETEVSEFNLVGTSLASFGGNVTINGFEFTPATNATPGSQVSISSSYKLSGLLVENNVFSGYGSVALATYNAGNININHNYFENAASNSEAMQVKADASATGGCNSTQVLYNTFSAATNNGGADINFSCTDSNSSYATITGNSSTGNTNGSSFAAFSGVDSNISIIGNSATTDGNDLFFAGNVSGAVEINQNDFTSGNGYAVSIHGGDGWLGTDDAANSGTFTISHNDLSGNAAGVNIASGSMIGNGAVKTNNNDLSSTQPGYVAVNNNSSISVDATDNYWGASPDFTSLIGGSGKANVAYSPYYINSARTHLNTDTVGTVYVDPTYNSSSAGGHEYGWDAFSTIQAGVNALSSGGTVNVNAGTYNENVTLSQAVDLVGANKTTTFINGMVTINAAGSSVSGFDITNSGGDFGVLINHVSNISVAGNNIHGVSGIGTNDYGVYFQSGGSSDVSTVTVSDNTISNIGSASNAKSAGAIGIGDSSAHMNITSGLKVQNNIISNINSSTKGAYGILLNLGSSSSLSADTASVSGALITGNAISGLSGGWEHAIGLETNTPNADLSGNTISGLSAGSDVEAVHFEKNPSASTVTLTGSTFDGKSLSNSNTNVTVDTSAPVVPSTSELNTYLEYLVGNTYGYTGLNVFNTVQSAVDGVVSGGTVTVPAGNFSENVTLNKALTLKGAGSSIAGTVIQPASGNAVTVVASGMNSANPLTIEGLRLSSSSGNGVYFNSTATHVKLSDVETVNSVYGIEVHNSAVLNDLVFDNVGASNNQIGFRVATTGSVNGLTITNSSFDYNTSEGIYIAASSSKTSNQNDFTNISISDTTFSNDGNKGIYAEKLDHATFTNVTVDNSGISGSSASGFNINEKYGAYQNITLDNMTVTNSGTGDTTSGTGINIEARDDGGYASNPATLDGVTISGGTISGNQVGLRFGETGKNNTGPTNVSIKKVDLSGNIGLALNNQTQANIDASQNYWGSASPDFSTLVSGTATDSPWYTDQALTKLASSSNVSTTSSSTGTASLPSGSTGVTLDSSTKLDLSSGLSGSSGGNITVGGSTQSLGNYSSGNISGRNLNSVSVSGTTVSVGQAVQLQSGSSGQPITITNTGLNNVTVSVPDSTTILAPSSWDGTIAPPKTVSAAGTAPSGFSVGNTVVEVGSPNNVLLFDKPVLVELDGVTGQVGYKAAGSGTWVLIPSCTNTDFNTAQDPGFPGACSVSDGTNTKIWTYHFTEFANMNTVSSSNSGSSSSSSSSSGSKVVTTSSSTPSSSSSGGGAGSSVQGESANASSGQTSSTSTKQPALANLSQPKVAAKEAGATGLRWYWFVIIAIVAVALAAMIAYRYAEGTDES